MTTKAPGPARKPRGTVTEREAARKARTRPKGPLTGTWDDGDPKEAGRQDAITRRMEAALRAEARKRDAKDRELHEGGRAEAKAEHAAKGADRRRQTVKKHAKRQGRRVARKATRPVRATTSGTWVGIGIGTLALVLLYNALQAADQLAGFLGGVQKAIHWLADPTAIIPFKE